jgi:hypothetical protein
MFHKCDDRVAKPAQLGGLAAVAFAVVSDLLAPPFAVALRLGIAAGAAVPVGVLVLEAGAAVGALVVEAAGVLAALVPPQTFTVLR